MHVTGDVALQYSTMQDTAYNAQSSSQRRWWEDEADHLKRGPRHLAL